MTKDELLTGKHTTMYTRIQDEIAEDIKRGEHKLFVGREFYKDDHVLWLDNQTMNRLIEDGFHVEQHNEHEWRISW